MIARKVGRHPRPTRGVALGLFFLVLGAAPGAAQDSDMPSAFDVGGSLTGFGEGLLSSDGDNSLAAGGKALLTFGLNGEAAGIASGLFINGSLELNFGENVNTKGDGTILPVNTALAFPDDESDFGWSLTLTQRLGETTSLTVGKFNMLSAAAPTPLIGGGGLETFQNIGLAGPPSGVTPPYVLGGMVSFKAAGWDMSVFLYDPRDAANEEVFEKPFSEGVTYSFSAKLPVAPNGLKGVQGVRLVYATAEGVDFDSIPELALPPGTGDVLVERQGYYYAAYSFQQYLVQEPSGAGWGVFGQLAVSDGNPNPIQSSALVGLGGNATFFGRVADRWGVGVFHYHFSDDLKDGLRALGGDLRDERGFEAFYEAELSPNFRVGADLQVIRPGTPGVSTAVFAGLRARLVF
jgi:porin